MKNQLSAGRPRVGLLIETSNAYSRGVLKGINAYIHKHFPWSLYLGEYSRGLPDVSWLLNWNGEGIIARIDSPQTAAILEKINIPIVNVSSGYVMKKIPLIETNDKKIAELAANHFIELGLEQFAYCGVNYNWSDWRKNHFHYYLQEKGFKCHIYPYDSEPEMNWDQDRIRLTEWLYDLPKPAGVFAAFDSRAQNIIQICQNENILVPESLAIIGVDNDDLICEFCDPPLTSVIPDSFRTGFLAARCLDRMMQGDYNFKERQFIEPLGIQKRKSTDIKAINDPDISRAMHYIHKHACEGLNVQQLLSFLPMSRRVFEKRFKRMIGHSPYEEILRIKIVRVRELLIETDLTQGDIAQRAGFKYESYMNQSFKRVVGQPPGVYRQEHKGMSAGNNSNTSPW
ncbi:MAG: DNA-binding transcriptional regulator [candidate division KSB1 bacterium]|nr:DNA-binding transcriptional regulator [candidate division KSB1 bacterium]